MGRNLQWITTARMIRALWWSYPTILKNNTSNNLKNPLGLRIDENGMIRCHGKMISENLRDGIVFPKPLPKNHAITSPAVSSHHENLMHSGVSHTLSAISKELWISQGRATVRIVILNCPRSRRHQGGSYRMPQMAPYPPSRIEESFTYTGLDYLGHL